METGGWNSTGVQVLGKGRRQAGLGGGKHVGCQGIRQGLLGREPWHPAALENLSFSPCQKEMALHNRSEMERETLHFYDTCQHYLLLLLHSYNFKQRILLKPPQELRLVSTLPLYCQDWSAYAYLHFLPLEGKGCLGLTVLGCISPGGQQRILPLTNTL